MFTFSSSNSLTQNTTSQLSQQLPQLNTQQIKKPIPIYQQKTKKVILQKSKQFSIPIPEEGLINYLVGKGFSDDVFIVEDEKIPCISYLVKEKNKTLRKLMEDEKREKEIRISENVTKTGFKVLMIYYGYGKVEIDERNVIDVLMVSLYYEELDLIEKCKEFLSNCLNITLIQEIFNKLPCGRVLDDLKIIFKSYMRMYGYKLLDDSMLMNNNIEILKYLLSINNFVVKSDEYILEQLNKFDDKIPKKRTIDNNKKCVINDLKKMVKNSKIKRIFIDPKPTKDEKFNELFYYYCLCNYLKRSKIPEKEEYCRNELQKLELEKFLPELIRNRVILTLANSVDLINDFNLKYDVETIPMIKYKCNNPYIFDDFKMFLPKYHSFCKELFYTFKSNNKNMFLRNVMSSRSRNIPPIYFGYENMNYQLKQIPMTIESGFIGDGCDFSINCNDSSEIECDKYTGDLTLKKNVNKIYCVTCENDYGFISLELSINNNPDKKRINNHIFQRGYKSNKQIKVDSNSKTVLFSSDDDYIVFDGYYNGEYSIPCSGYNVMISACTTRENKGENNKKFNIMNCTDGYVSYKIFFDMNRKQLGYYVENNVKRIIHSNINSPVYFMVESIDLNSYFAYGNVEKIN